MSLFLHAKTACESRFSYAGYLHSTWTLTHFTTTFFELPFFLYTTPFSPLPLLQANSSPSPLSTSLLLPSPLSPLPSPLFPLFYGKLRQERADPPPLSSGATAAGGFTTLRRWLVGGSAKPALTIETTARGSVPPPLPTPPHPLGSGGGRRSERPASVVGASGSTVPARVSGGDSRIRRPHPRERRATSDGNGWIHCPTLGSDGGAWIRRPHSSQGRS